MSDVSAVLALPYIQPAQAQKHVTHNEALRLLDIIVQLAVLDRTRNAPPAAPATGARHIVGPQATGAWEGQSGRIALFDIDGWSFVAPLRGWRAEVLAEGQSVVFDGTAWIAAGEMPQRVVQLGVSATPDATNRLSVSSPATLLNHAGGGHQLKLNKAAAGDTASLLFQTGFSGRAEMGLAGTDAFSVKVSADGAAFAEALRVETGGAVTLPQGALLPDGTAARPALAFSADADTGLMRMAADRIGLVAGGAARAQLSATALQVDVQVVGLAAQGSSHDSQSGKLAKLHQTGGVFGLGVVQGQSLGTVVAAANSVSVAGFYRTDATTANLPATATSGLLEVFHGAGGGVVHQRWTAAGTDAATRQWHRRAAAGVWTAWSMVYGQSTLLGSVAQAGGVPTGAAMERASTPNGDYVRLADGTQICSRAALTVPNAATAAGALFRSAPASWTFPVAFAMPPVVTGAVEDADCWASAGLPDTAAAPVQVMSWMAKAAPLTLRLLAVGRWF